MLGGILRSSVLEASADEPLGIVADAEEFIVAKAPVSLAEVNVLVLRANPGAGACLEISDGGLLIGSGSCWWGYGEKHQIGECVALPIIIEKEKKFFTDDRTAEVSAELVEVIRRFPEAFNLIDGVVGVQALVAKEFKGGAVEIVSAGLGDDVNYCSSGMAEFGGIRVGIHLEFLDRVFAELVGSPARSSAAYGLAEESVVVVRTIDDEGIESAALSCKADVAAANVEGDAWSEKDEIDEVAAVSG